ncbi:hypothetical protein [Blautia hydrogenotrophica]|uniref:hypothetical protein n=1 Tax=Blautia hydrogenotrophica TaxID=53443 RepID=UPI00258419E4|nr:hypothetical protein [Blautia hydrogenotrophica]
MFEFGKKEKKSLWIMSGDVVEIIKSDYDNDMAFTLIEFLYNGQKYRMGSCVLPTNEEEKKENIYFVFQDEVYKDFGEFQAKCCIDGKKISDLEMPIGSSKQASLTGKLC